MWPLGQRNRKEEDAAQGSYEQIEDASAVNERETSVGGDHRTPGRDSCHGQCKDHAHE